MNKNATRKKMNIKKIITIFSTVLTAIFVFLSVAFLIVGAISIRKGKYVRLFGYSFSTVITPSMEDTIMVNDIIIIKKCDFDTIKKNDIIVYYNNELNINVVHRVIGFTIDGALITKGDNNNDPDTINTTEDNFVGIVVKYGKFGGLGKVVANYRYIIFIIIICVFSYVLISELVNIIKTVSSKNKEINKPDIIDKEKMRQELLEEIRKELEEKNK